MIGQLKAVGSIPGSWLSSAASCVITAWEVKVRVTVSPRLASDSFGTVTVTDWYRPGWTYSAALRGGYQTTWTSARIREPLPRGLTTTSRLAWAIPRGRCAGTSSTYLSVPLPTLPGQRGCIPAGTCRVRNHQTDPIEAPVRYSAC